MVGVCRGVGRGWLCQFQVFLSRPLIACVIQPENFTFSQQTFASENKTDGTTCPDIILDVVYFADVNQACHLYKGIIVGQLLTPRKCTRVSL